MATDNFIYQGINRAVSDYAGSRACEELINLRPTEGGVVPVRDFTAKMTNKPFLKFFVHHTTSGDKYIVLRTVADGDDVSVQYVDENGTLVQVLFGPIEFMGDPTVDAIHFATAGNELLISVCDRAESVFANRAYTWKDGVYQEMEANVPSVTFSVSDGTDLETATQSIPALTQDSESTDALQAVDNAINAIQENNPELCLGPVIIAVAFKTKDGNTFWTGGWTLYDPIKKIGTTSPPYMTGSDLNQTYTAPLYTDFLAEHDGHAYVINDGHSDSYGWLGHEGRQLDQIRVYGTKVTLTFPAITGWNEDTSIVQSVEVYCSKPVPYLDTATAGDGFKWRIWDRDMGMYVFNIMLAQKKYEDMDLIGQLLYHQASIQMSALSSGSQTVTLSFGGNIQMSEDTLDTDAGALKRYGRVLSYNARFHYFDSVSHIDVGKPYFLYSSTGTSATANLFARYADANHSELVYLGTTSGYLGPAYMVIAPSLNIKEVIVYAPGNSASQRMIYTYRMDESPSYNFTFHIGGPNAASQITGTAPELEALIRGGVVGITTEEPDAINVTEQYNPFVFLVEHSYKAPGNIIDVLPQMAGIVDASYGRDPLNVFTERGLYALTQGSANVLYGAFLPLSNLKARRGGIPLESGIYFLADGGLWLVSGRQVVLMSEALNLGPHKYVRDCTGYKKLSGTDTDYSPIPAPANPYYDVSPHLSRVEFKDFVNGGRLAYNRFRMELFVCNPAYQYTYVLSLKYRQWFKVSKRLWQDDPGSPLVNTFGSIAGTISILDMSNESTGDSDSILIHLQSRPFSMGYQYSHVHRIVAMVRAMLPTSGHRLAVGLYGSDDLQHWKLLAYAKRSGGANPLFLSQVRTTSSARSWRYYTVCIGGYIPVDQDFPTDVGPVIVDYEPVIRRIG